MSDDEGGMLRQYIPALLDDNPSLEEDDPNYEAKLKGLGSPALVRAMRYGDWDVIQGAFFPEFSREKHVIRPFKIPDHWIKFRSYDHGHAKPFSVGWHAVSDGTAAYRGDEELFFPAGALIRYREWYGATKPNEGLRIGAADIAQGILSRQAPGEKIRYSVGDPSITKEEGGPSIRELLADNGVYFDRADNTRLAGWAQCRDRLIGHDDKPMYYVFDTCHDFIRTVPALQHDEKKPEDVDTEGEDHTGDEWRYACMSRPYHRPVPKKVKPKTVKDMTFNEYIDKYSKDQGSEDRY